MSEEANKVGSSGEQRSQQVFGWSSSEYVIGDAIKHTKTDIHSIQVVAAALGTGPPHKLWIC